MSIDRDAYIHETEEYRELRDQLLQEEVALSDQTEWVPALRRLLPTNPVNTDYLFREGRGELSDNSQAGFHDVRLSELFNAGKSTLLIQHVM